MPPTPTDVRSILPALARLYDDIDNKVLVLSQIHADRLHCCPGCADCCVDDISVSEVEALNIRRFFADLLCSEAPHSEGSCAFLSADKTCRIYTQRPYVCRTQGLPLHWLEEQDGKTVAMRDICPQSEEGTPVEQLPEHECWIIGPAEESLAHLQHVLGGGLMRRVKLRKLFAPSERPCR